MSDHEITETRSKAYIVRGAGMTMSEVVEVLAERIRMEQQVFPNLSGKLKAWLFTLWRGGGAVGCGGVRHCVAETEEIRSSRKIYGYIRVSTREQNEDRQVALREVGVPERNVYIDKQSGKDFERPQYKAAAKNEKRRSALYQEH